MKVIMQVGWNGCTWCLFMDLLFESYHARYLRRLYMKVVHECIHEGYHWGCLRWLINEGCSRMVFKKVIMPVFYDCCICALLCMGSWKVIIQVVSKNLHEDCSWRFYMMTIHEGFSWQAVTFIKVHINIFHTSSTYLLHANTLYYLGMYVFV